MNNANLITPQFVLFFVHSVGYVLLNFQPQLDVIHLFQRTVHVYTATKQRYDDWTSKTVLFPGNFKLNLYKFHSSS